MDTREVAMYGYQLDNTMNKLVGASVAAVFLAIGCAVSLSPWFLLFLLIPVAVIIYVKRSGCNKPLLIASRYLILGDRIVYYRTVSSAIMDTGMQTLTLGMARGKSVIIAAERFPTNARKPDKIKNNKTAKFRKVADKIINRLHALSPDCEFS